MLPTGVHSRPRHAGEPLKKSDASIMAGPKTLHPDFVAFVELLNAHDVRYLVVGGYAVAFHGHPRYTKDLDIWVAATVENAGRLLDALAEFGFGSSGLATDDFLQPDTIIQLGYPPNRIDLLTELPGVTFNESYQSLVAIKVEGVTVQVIGLEELKINKKTVGRHQDLADLDNLDG
jgi:predicted nucleotidyltransferase